MIKELPENLTIGESYGPAMKITDPEDAKDYFEALVQHSMKYHNLKREQAEKLNRTNLGYYAGYYDNETRARIEKLFNCVHPIFGPISKHTPTAKEAFEAGKALAETSEEKP